MSWLADNNSSIEQGGFRARVVREHSWLVLPSPRKMKLITTVRSAQESPVLATHVCSGLGCAGLDSLVSGNGNLC